MTYPKLILKLMIYYLDIEDLSYKQNCKLNLVIQEYQWDSLCCYTCQQVVNLKMVENNFLRN